MKIKELTKLCFCKVIVSVQDDSSPSYFRQLYKGKLQQAPSEILELDVELINNAGRKNIIDILVQGEANGIRASI